MDELLKRITVSLCDALAVSETTEHDTLCQALAICLKDADALHWVPALPVAYIHNAKRMKSDVLQKRLIREGWVGQDDKIREGMSRSEIMQMAGHDAGVLVQAASIAACLNGAPPDCLPFSAKRSGDYWKRLKSADFLAAIIEIDVRPAMEVSPEWIARALAETDAGQWQAETALRDAVRSKKENTPLRGKPFVWVSVISGAEEKDAGEVNSMLRHYFGEALRHGIMPGGYFVMGYSEALNDISLRTFYKKC